MEMTKTAFKSKKENKRDIENRYQPPILLKKMTKRYLGLRLEGMDKVMEKL